MVEKMEGRMDIERGMTGDGWRDGCSRKQELLGRGANAACPFSCLGMKNASSPCLDTRGPAFL